LTRVLLLIFHVAENQYAVDAARVREVVPRVGLRFVPHAPGYLAGLFNYRGQVVPVVDFGLLLGQPACRPRLSTRIIIVDTAADERVEYVPLGLIAEQVSDVRDVPGRQPARPASPLTEAPYLGPIVQLDDGLVQLIDVNRILTGALLDAFIGGRSERP
jgi:chemotaxis-related protein WspB